MTTLVELYSQPGTWTQGAYARDKYGWPASVDCLTACEFCLVGAIYKVYGRSGPKTLEIVKKIEKVLGYDIEKFNDAPGRTQEEILELCKRAGV